MDRAGRRAERLGTLSDDPVYPVIAQRHFVYADEKEKTLRVK
jgi:hypothetical protein